MGLFLSDELGAYSWGDWVLGWPIVCGKVMESKCLMSGIMVGVVERHRFWWMNGTFECVCIHSPWFSGTTDICMHVGTTYTYSVLKALEIVEWADVLRTFTCIQGLMFNICMHIGTTYAYMVLKALETCLTLCALLNHLDVQFNDLQHSCKGITPCSWLRTHTQSILLILTITAYMYAVHSNHLRHHCIHILRVQH